MKAIFRLAHEKTLVSLQLMGFHCAIHNVTHKPGTYFHYLPYYFYLYFTLSIPNNKLIFHIYIHQFYYRIIIHYRYLLRTLSMAL